MIQKESSGRADAVGVTGDRGLMQINPDAHPRFFATRDWRDPRASVDYGASILRDNLRFFDGDVDKAIAAYNAGCGGVRGGLARGKTLDEITFKPHYVRDIEAYARAYEKYF